MIPPLLFSIRKAPQGSTGYAPFELVYAHSPRGLLDIKCEEWVKGTGDLAQPQAMIDFRERLRRAQEISQKNLGHSQEKQKEHHHSQTVGHYHFQTAEIKLQVGDWVMG